VLCWAIFGTLALRAADLVLRGVGTELLVISPQSIAFWIEIMVGFVIPLAILLTPVFAASVRWLLVTSVMVICGLVLNRMNVAVVGITAPYSPPYYPFWMEVGITIGIVAGGVLAYLAICSNFPVFGAAHTREA
jgi:formate dehydrogenase iron-sulfur subunit